MLYFNRNTENTFVVVASEKLEATISDFLFVFTDETSNKKYEITLTDLSNFPKTFNKFTINLPNDLEFDHNGDYLYEVINPNNDESLTIGRMRLKGDKIASKSYDIINKESEQYER